MARKPTETRFTREQALDMLEASTPKHFSLGDRLILVACKYLDGQETFVWKAKAREDSQIDVILIDDTGTTCSLWHGHHRATFWQAFKPGIMSWEWDSRKSTWRRLV